MSADGRFSSLLPLDNVYLIKTASDLPQELDQWRIYHLLYDPGAGVGLYYSPDNVTLTRIAIGGGLALPIGTVNDSIIRWNGATWVEFTAFVLPIADGFSGQVMVTDGLGVVSWAAAGGVAAGTVLNNTLRWDGAAWVESPLLKNNAAGIISLAGLLNADGDDRSLDFTWADGTLVGRVGWELGTGSQLNIRNNVISGGVLISARDSSGVVRQKFFSAVNAQTQIFAQTNLELLCNISERALLATANAQTALYYNSVLSAQTNTVVNGGWFVNNGYNGFNGGSSQERVLTNSEKEIGYPTIVYQFSTSITAIDPSTTFYRFNSVTWSAVTQMYIDDISTWNRSGEWLISSLRSGDTLVFRSDTTVDDYAIFVVTGAPTDNTGWWTVPMAFIAQGTSNFGNNERTLISVQFGGAVTSSPQTITATWSTGSGAVQNFQSGAAANVQSGGIITIESGALLRLGEQAAQGAVTAAFGQVWVRNDVPNVLMFTDDAGTDFVVGGVPSLFAMTAVGSAITYTNQPNSLQFWAASTSRTNLIDLSKASQVRMTTQVTTASASVNTPIFLIRYNTTANVTPGTWIQIGSSELSISLSTTGFKDTGWINIAAGAQIASCFVTTMGNGGNAVADPNVRNTILMFR